jgi:hypothetical protein
MKRITAKILTGFASPDRGHMYIACVFFNHINIGEYYFGGRYGRFQISWRMGPNGGISFVDAYSLEFKAESNIAGVVGHANSFEKDTLGEAIFKINGFPAYVQNIGSRFDNSNTIEKYEFLLNRGHNVARYFKEAIENESFGRGSLRAIIYEPDARKIIENAALWKVQTRFAEEKGKIIVNHAAVDAPRAE